jgi:hypothetical protein
VRAPYDLLLTARIGERAWPISLCRRSSDVIPFQALKKNPAGPHLVENHSLTYLTGAAVPTGNGTLGGNKRFLLVENPDRTLSPAGSPDRPHQEYGPVGFEN